jgi:FkbM family methyltransferase
LISYAQNFEDVMLERVFTEESTGFYIDVGACDDVIYSVTKHFYEKGWHGINVEPIPAYSAKLQQLRERDINLNIALLDTPGKNTLYAITDTGLSTFDANHADEHRAKGFEVKELQVEVSTLEAICEEYAKDTPIDFLKVDTEGTELQVLQGGNWLRFRPRVLVIEATLPLSQKVSHGEWETFILKQGYIFAYFDGLNRFYVREEEPDLLRHFSCPPNVFDSFIPYSTFCAERKAKDLENRLKSTMRKADEFDKFRGSFLGRLLHLLRLLR